MNELQKKLEHVGFLLCSALNEYLDVCSSIEKSYQLANTAGGVPKALSASVSSQISLITTLYETKLKRAKSTLSWAINSSSDVVPINCLPSEILMGIFHLVVGIRPCGVKHNSGAKITLPKYPDFLSRVCTRWRQIVMDTPTLWSHIDLVPFSSRSQGFEARAKAFITRAGNSLLDIHVYEPAFYEDFGTESMLEFLVSIAPRIRSLEFVIPDTSEALDESVIECCFENCTPGTFTELSITDNGSTAPNFLEAADDPDDVSDSLWLNIPPDYLEELLLPVTVLRLDGVFLPWQHKLYHELVELRLTSTREPTLISEHELVGILLLSPRLRILYFGLTIISALPEDSHMFPVRLNDLEVLDLTSLEYSQLGTFLRLLSPGSRSLRLSFDPYVVDDLPLCEDSVKDFFARSNVRELHLSDFSRGTYQRAGELISPISNLRVLAMIGVYSFPSPHSTPNSDNHTTPAARSPLDVLYMIRGRVDLDELETFIKQYPVNTLVFWNCKVFDGRNIQSDCELQTKFSKLCHSVRCIGKDAPNPIENWD